MPIQKVSGGFKWGEHGHTYPTREGAVKQAQAAYANGYKGYSEGGEVTGNNMQELHRKILEQCLQHEMDGASHEVLKAILQHETEGAVADKAKSDETVDEPTEVPQTEYDEVTDKDGYKEGGSVGYKEGGEAYKEEEPAIVLDVSSEDGSHDEDNEEEDEEARKIAEAFLSLMK